MKALVLTLSFGSGHVRAAQATAHELTRQAPSAEVLFLDALEQCRPLFRACYEWPYWFMLRYAPILWDTLSAARIKHKHESTAPSWAFRFGCPKVFETIKSFAPDLIIAVEVAACEMAAIARQSGMTGAPILSVITDYEAEPVWVKPEVDGYAVADQNVLAELVDWGASKDRIVTCGIPVDPVFSLTHDDVATRLRHGINDDLPIVLLMGGGMGPTRMDEVAWRLGESRIPMHIVAIAGQDKRARSRLERLNLKAPVSLRVLGWTDDVAALMQAASLLVTKPGGLTLAEAAMCSLPAVLFDPIPGAELVNARRMVDTGAAVITDGGIETTTKAISLLRDERTRHAMSLRANQMARPHARAQIASLALELAGNSKRTAQRMTA